MKFILIVACIFTLTLANEMAEVLRNEREVNPENFYYTLELDNHIRAEQRGNLDDNNIWVVTGEYEYLSPEGKTIKVSYRADETGYHPHIETIH